MNVETYDCTEVRHEPAEAVEAAASLAEELGLTGQSGLFSQNNHQRSAFRR